MSSSWGLRAQAGIESAPASPSSEVLNFLAAITSVSLPLLTGLNLTTNSSQYEAPRFVGSGGFATIQVVERKHKNHDTDNVELVAVKRSGASAPFDVHFSQLTLELRILAHERLRLHPYIVDVRGLYLDGRSAELVSLALVLEYSDFGNLAHFLAHRREEGSELPMTDKIELLSQVCCGLNALHELRICHGDVKTQNVLVFENQGALVAKVSDFGSSVVSDSSDGSALVTRPGGTPLLTAPEIRNAYASNSTSFTIDDALRTDVYSFGLLVWEVLKNGDSYFGAAWLAMSEDDEATSVEVKEDFLRDLEHDALVSLGIEYLRILGLESVLYEKIKAVFGSTLQYNPSKRSRIPDICKILDDDAARHSHSQTPSGPADNCILAWTIDRSFYELLENEHRPTNKPIDRLPTSLQQKVFKALVVLASPENPTPLSTHAAMTVAECYTMAYGCSYDTNAVLHWLRIAAASGNRYASMWSARVHNTLEQRCTDSACLADDIHAELANITPSDYLSSRVKLLNFSMIEDVRNVTKSRQPNALDDLCVSVSVFDSLEVDNLPHLHIASLSGDNSWVTELLKTTDIHMRSQQGFTAIDYACIGGQLSTLKLLLSHGSNASVSTNRNITPLHLSIFFSRDTMADAVKLLIASGVSLTTESGRFAFSYHDIRLEGDALMWSVLTRNYALARILAPHMSTSSKLTGIRCALYMFFHEIADYLLSVTCIPDDFDPPSVYAIRRPFLHWIAHGLQSQQDIQNTISLAEKHGWNEFLALLVGRLQPGDLNEYVLDGGKMTYFQMAVKLGAVEAARIFLEVGGANVNLRMNHETQLSPLHICAFRDSTPQMWSLLLEHGADMRARASTKQVTPFQLAIMERRFNPMKPELLQSILQKTDDDVRSEVLHGLLNLMIRPAQHDLDDFFRWALSQQELCRKVNSRDEYGATMLQKAALHLHRDAVCHLLGAMADAGASLISNGYTILPLQLVCFRARLLYTLPLGHKSGKVLEADDSELQYIQGLSEALEIAAELLDCHADQGDDFLEGITKMHLLYRMRAFDHHERLGLAFTPDDASALGSWPGLEGKFTPEDLGDAGIEDETSAIKAALQEIETIRLDFP
ncbi:hypothetical protein PG991_014054 [Apiospora marii]|uniref:Protein kinase domain-containing protein n=1 Tax=Apiospora marii TaxID=335849 RepID=A0ABR1R8I7_9PEZI